MYSCAKKSLCLSFEISSKIILKNLCPFKLLEIQNNQTMPWFIYTSGSISPTINSKMFWPLSESFSVPKWFFYSLMLDETMMKICMRVNVQVIEKSRKVRKIFYLLKHKFHSNYKQKQNWKNIETSKWAKMNIVTKDIENVFFFLGCKDVRLFIQVSNKTFSRLVHFFL